MNRLVSLEKKETRYQSRRDSLLLMLEQKREEALNERISAESKYAEKLFTLAEKQLEKAYQAPQGSSRQGGERGTYENLELGMQYPYGQNNSNNWIWAVIILVIIASCVYKEELNYKINLKG